VKKTKDNDKMAPPAFSNLNYLFIGEIEYYTLSLCPDYTPNFIQRMLLLCRFLPLFVTAGYYGASLFRKELYILLVGIGLTLDSLLNDAYVRAFQQRGPNPGCGFNYNMPDAGTEQMFFLAMSICTYHGLWYVQVSRSNRIFVTIMPALIIAANMRLGYSSSAQCMVGAIAGTVHAMLWQLFINYVIQPHMDRILEWRICTYLGYRDTMCRIAPEHAGGEGGEHPPKAR
jgi:hypothetical protein